jgi:NTE family protein
LHPLSSLGLEIVWVTRMEAALSDWYVGTSTGQFSLMDRRNLDRIFRMGYDSGVKFSMFFR